VEQLFDTEDPLGTVDQRWEAFEHEVWGPSDPYGHHVASAVRWRPSHRTRLALGAAVLAVAAAGLTVGLTSASPPQHVQGQDVVKQSSALGTLRFCGAATAYFTNQAQGAHGAGRDLSDLAQMVRWAPSQLHSSLGSIADGLSPLLAAQSLPGFSASHDSALIARGLREDSSTAMITVKDWVSGNCVPSPQPSAAVAPPPPVAVTTTTIATSSSKFAPPLPEVSSGCVTFMPDVIGLTYTAAGIEIDKVLLGFAVVGERNISAGSLVVSTTPAPGTCLDPQMKTGQTFPVTLNY
jgi:hypothetical protein